MTARPNDSASATEADENDESRRTRPILRQRPEGGNTVGRSNRANGSGNAAFRFAAIRLTVPFAWRECAGHRFTGAAFARTHQEISHPAPALNRWAPSNEARLDRVSAPDRPSSTSTIIIWFLANGYTMAQIRIMFPGLFYRSPGPES
jgi:hypothetical protein